MIEWKVMWRLKNMWMWLFKDKKEYFIFSSDDARCGKKVEGRNVSVEKTSCACTAPKMEYG